MVSDHPERVNLEEFYSCSKARARHLENAHLYSTINQTGTDKRSPRHRVFATRTNYSTDETNHVHSCLVHNSRNHTLENCKAFQQMSPQEKENAICKLKLCFGCLRSNHLARNCNRKVKCGIDGCTDNDHKLLDDVQCLRSKPSPVHNPAGINPTATAFSPRDNSGQMSTQNMSSASEETPGQEVHHTACYGHQPKKSLLQFCL